MFKPTEIQYVSNWIKDNKEVVVSGLDLDYQGKILDTTIKLIELEPDNISNKLAVCDVCHQYKAKYTQVLKDNKEVLGGVSSVLPEDGTYDYQARCRNCFIKA
jgi:thymidine kinase